MTKGAVNHINHQKELRSKQAFETLMNPSVVNWTIRDYGTDGLVTLHDKIGGDGSAQLSSMHFLVQLKATERDASSFQMQIPVNKIIDWLQSNVPVFLVVFVQNKNAFYFKSINESFSNFLTKNKPGWNAKQTIGISFTADDTLSEDAIKIIRTEVRQRTPKRAMLLPGTYFKLKTMVSKLVERFFELSSPMKFDSVNNSIQQLEKNLDLAMYKVAIMGPSRSGKSTLINCLLKRDISPIGIFQTTGVPLQVVPGAADKVEVFFTNGKKSSHSYSSKIIKDYVSQNENRGNEKKVNFVSVTVVNELLEKGIAFFDVPGMDDPDDDVVTNTLAFVNTFNAIVYVLDVSPAKNGGFLIRSDVKKQLINLTSTLDKVFLVFNKVDELSESRLDETKNYINRELDRWDIAKKVDSKIFYLSAGTALNTILAGRPDASTEGVTNLSGEIWKFILEGNRNGIYSLLSVTKGVRKGISDFESLLKVRLLEADKLDQIQSTIQDIRMRTHEIRSMLKRSSAEAKEALRLLLIHELTTHLGTVENKLRSIPLNQELPPEKETRGEIVMGMHAIFETGNAEFAKRINLAKLDIDRWIETHLKRISEFLNHNTEKRLIDIAGLENMKFPEIDLSMSFGIGVFGAIVGSFISAGAALFVGLLGFIFHRLISVGDSRSRRIAKIMEKARERCNQVIAETTVKYHELVDEYIQAIEKYANEKIILYFSDLKKEMEHLRNSPLSASERVIYGQVFNHLRDLDETIEEVKDEVVTYQ